MTISCQNDYFLQIQGILTVFCIISPSCWLSKALKTTPYSIFSCPHSFFLLSLQREHPERIPNGSRTKRSSGLWFSQLFLDRSSIVSRSVFDSFSFVSRSTFDGSSIDLRSSFVLPSFVLRLPNEDLSKIYRRNSEQKAKLLLRHYGGETNYLLR